MSEDMTLRDKFALEMYEQFVRQLTSGTARAGVVTMTEKLHAACERTGLNQKHILTTWAYDAADFWLDVRQKPQGWLHQYYSTEPDNTDKGQTDKDRCDDDAASRIAEAIARGDNIPAICPHCGVHLEISGRGIRKLPPDDL